MDQTDYIEEFLVEYQNSNTNRNYKADLLSFFGGKTPSLEDLLSVKRSQVLSWRREARSFNWKGSTINRRLTTVTKFFKFLVETGYLKSNPTQIRGLKRLTAYSWVPKSGLEQEQTLQLLSACVADRVPKTQRQVLVNAAIAARDKAIIALAITALLRRTEIAHIDIEDITCYGDTNILTIRHTNDGENDRVSIIPEAMDYISTYLKCLEPLKALLPPRSSRNALFVGLGNRNFGRRLSGWSIYNMVVKRAEEAGFDFRVSPHLMRHTGITQLLEDGLPLHEVRISARHKDPRTTMLYNHNLQGLKNNSTRSLKRMIVKKQTASKKE